MSVWNTLPAQPQPHRLRHFVAGLGLGLLVGPASLAFAFFAGGSAIVGCGAFALMLVGACSIRPVNAQRTGGIVTGVVVTAVAAFGLLVWAFSQMQF